MQKSNIKTTDQKSKTILMFLVYGFGFIFLVFGFFWYIGLFPIASINDDWLWKRDLAKSEKAIERLQETSSDGLLPALGGTTTPLALARNDIRRGAFEELIREKIAAQELRRIDSFQDWDERIARDIEGLLSGRDKAALSRAARELYALNLEDFKRLVLAPQIREDLLRKELALRAEDPDAWLENAFQNAQVKIYFLNYEWRDGRLFDNYTRP